MPLLNTSIPNLAQGVSQQPDNLRYPGQCDEQINAWSTVVEGLVKRPNSRFLYDTGLAPNVNSNLFTHFVDRDEQNKYVISYDSVNGLKARDLTADNDADGDLTVNVVDATANTYLTCSDPNKELRALTIADSTFIVNTTKTVTKNSTLKSKDLEKEALIFVKLGDYEKTYDVFLDGQLVPFDSGAPNQSNKTPPSGHTYESGSSSTGEHADTELIAQDLQAQINSFVGSAGVLSGVTFTTGTGSGFAPTGGSFTRKVSYTYTVNQTIGNTVASGAGGEIVFDANGRVSSSTLTHKGTGYDSDIITNPLSLVIKKITSIKVDKGIRSISGRYSTTYDTEVITGAPYTLPTFSATVSGSTTKFTTEREDSVIKITADSDFQIKVADGLGNQALGVIYKEVDNITELPKECFNLFRVKIIGDADLDQDDYYVKFKTKDNEDFGKGSWIEDAGWTNEGTDKSESLGLETFFDQDTMPVRLVPTPDTGKITGFTLNLVEWTPRGAGDDNTNPFPSFTGSTINDIFFFKNRLGVLTDDAVVFSEADEYFNFFRTTTQSLLDSAPIDVGVSHTKISVLKFAQAFQQKLMLFSPKTQFVLRGGDLLTPKTVTISPVTEYDVAESIRPLALSSNIYFNFKRNNFEGLLEYTIDNNTETYGASEITEQVNKYIPSNIIRMAGSAAENMIVVQSTTDYKKLYVYKYFWQGREKIQSAWMTFTFAKEIRGFHFIQSDLFVITTDSDGTFLEKIPMENGLAEQDRNYAILLDRRIQTIASPGVLSAFVNTISYTKTGSSSPKLFNGVYHTDVTFMQFQNGFRFKDGMAIYSKNGNKKVVTKSNVYDIQVLIDGRLASYVSDGGSFVSVGNDKYICTSTHTSSSDKKPGSGANWQSYWRKVTTSQAASVWADAQSYTTEVLYKCKQGHTSSSSILTSNVTYWEVTSEVDVAPMWSADGFEYISESDYFVGYEYDMLYRFSKQNLKQPTERGGRSASDYTFQTIRNGSIEHTESGHFDVEVTPKFRDKYTYTYNPSLLASVSTLSKFTPESGFFKFAVQAQPNDATIEIKSSSALPVKLLSAEFESTIISRSRRYGG
jgi:hypothetical protein